MFVWEQMPHRARRSVIHRPVVMSLHIGGRGVCLALHHAQFAEAGASHGLGDLALPRVPFRGAHWSGRGRVARAAEWNDIAATRTYGRLASAEEASFCFLSKITGFLDIASYFACADFYERRVH